MLDTHQLRTRVGILLDLISGIYYPIHIQNSTFKIILLYLPGLFDFLADKIGGVFKLFVGALPTAIFFYQFKVSLTVTCPVKMMTFCKETVSSQFIDIEILGVVPIFEYGME
jgi:hypothetical protein